MKQLPLTKGFVSVVDDDDFATLNAYKWSYNLSGGGPVGVRRCKRQKIYLHRQITGAPSGMEVDHINGNTLDNRRCNLRICTKSQNQANSTNVRSNKSGYKGVSFCNRYKMWKARITSEHKTHWLGYHKTADEAARAYDVAAVRLFGEYARTNFVVEITL